MLVFKHHSLDIVKKKKSIRRPNGSISLYPYLSETKPKKIVNRGNNASTYEARYST